MSTKTISTNIPWMTSEELHRFQENSSNQKFRNNVLFSKDMRISLDTDVSGYNLNSIVIGGSGSGKSFRIIEPNILQANTSYVINNPSGDLYEKYGAYLRYMGYHVRQLNLNDPEHSDHYNPLAYINSDEDVEALVNILMRHTNETEDDDLFWTQCESNLLCALISYLCRFGQPGGRNFSTILNLLHCMQIEDHTFGAFSSVDELFESIRRTNPDDFAVQKYSAFRLAADKTLKTVLVFAARRLKVFNLDTVCRLTDTDGLHLDKMADEKTALFITVPGSNGVFDFLSALLCHQIIQMNMYNGYGSCPVKSAWLVVDSDGKTVKVFRSKNKTEENDAREKAEAWLAKARSAKVKKHSNFNVGINYTIEAEDDDDSLILEFYGDRKLTEDALEKIKSGKVIQNNTTQCPMRIQFLLDEFSEIGYIADFAECLPKLWMYGMSAMIVTQSMEQIKYLYSHDWKKIVDGCDIFVYCGGGTTDETALLFAKRLGLSSVCRRGYELYAQKANPILSLLYAVSATDCIVCVKGYPPYIGEKYPTRDHPLRRIVEDLDAYSYEYEKQIAKVLGVEKNGTKQRAL